MRVKPKLLGGMGMKKRFNISFSTGVLVFAFILVLGAIPVHSHKITWWKISGGGGSSAAGTYKLSGTISQSDAGLLMGGTYTLVGGFWGMDFQQFIYLPLILRN
jgi:hypothetical protein